tara:strand:+ start:24987 stop:25871 length:885 start_codon:yes stop_codon:yes gene_type:complete
MKVFYADTYELPLPEKHRFPIDKYAMLRNKLVEKKLLGEHELFEAPMAQISDLSLAHSMQYIQGIKDQSLDPRELRKIGLPVGEKLWFRTLASVGGFLRACENALQDGFSSSLSGGTHHAHYDRGEGFCVFNDFAIATRKYAQLNILIIDLDVHQGNGNSSILANDENVFIFSMHGEKNYPYKKVPSHLDIALAEDVSDEEYLDLLKETLQKFKKMNFDFILYQAGVDALKHDSLGTLNLSYEALQARDALVFEYAKEKSLPIAMALGGGYSKPIDASVEAYINTYKEVNKFFR